MVKPYAVKDVFACLQVVRVCASMKLVLQTVFDLTLKMAWNVVSVCDVSDTRQRNGCSELVRKTWKVCLDTTGNEAVCIICKLKVERLIDVVCDVGVMIWTEVGTVFCTRDLT